MINKKVKLEVGDIIVCKFGYRLIVKNGKNVFLAIDLENFETAYDSETLEDIVDFYYDCDEYFRIIKNANIKIVEENLINRTLKGRE
ncbi:MAG: hypothetical protein HFJ13_11490 [Clostridium sp.]|jgi:hypothetical protein|uniref:hypothetical protein n=1 Tax=Clostridium sp. TaxID=1506 RepID=UPI0025C54C4B|nr:hypothetical protein [Clostridium sp.]MCI9069865.1 hypothetical protein [Clostridium sp.]MCI9304714.1 hypothetical protein [Clostridium sp.]